MSVELKEPENKDSDKKNKKTESNPQMAVINSVIKDMDLTDEYVNIFLTGSEELDKEIRKEQNKDKLFELKKKKVASLRERMAALNQIFRRDNYYRNLNNQALSIFYEIPTLAEEALMDNRIETAFTFARIWEENALEYFKECYPNFKEQHATLLEAVSKMRIIPMPGKQRFNSDTSSIDQSFSFENSI